MTLSSTIALNEVKMWTKLDKFELKMSIKIFCLFIFVRV